MKNNLIIKKFYEELSKELDSMEFSEPVAAVFNPLNYASDGLEKYLTYSEGTKRAVFLGMNPGPWGMAQTGVPFGEVNAVKNFLNIKEIKITPPEIDNTSYKISGLNCKRAEVSGKRLWGLFQERFGTAENFFRDHFVLNYCPLLFLADGEKGRMKNLTPDKLKKSERKKLFAACDSCLKKIIDVLNPKFVIAVGNFAEDRAFEALYETDAKIIKVLHPSPASPASNKNWGEYVTAELIASGVWK